MAQPALTLPRRFLYGPGPAMVQQSVCEAMSRPALGIRDPYFLGIVDDIRRGLRGVFGTQNRYTFPVPASGSAGMEAAVANFVPPGSRLALFTAGHFANRLGIMAERYGASVLRCESNWGTVFTAEKADAFLDRERPDVVAFVQAETSTGAYQSGRAIVQAAKRHGALVIADTVTSLGAMPVEIDDIGIDVAFSCTQKGLSGPAGLSPISISSRAWEQLEKRQTDPAAWYLDLRLMAKYFEPPHIYHHTPSPPLYYALQESLRVIEDEGLQNRWHRHRLAGEQLASGLEHLGFEYLVADPANRTWHLAVVKPPAGVDEAALRERLLARYDIEIAGGLGQLAGQILRIGVMGPLANSESVDYLLRAIADCV